MPGTVFTGKFHIQLFGLEYLGTQNFQCPSFRDSQNVFRGIEVTGDSTDLVIQKFVFLGSRFSADQFPAQLRQGFRDDGRPFFHGHEIVLFHVSLQSFFAGL